MAIENSAERVGRRPGLAVNALWTWTSVVTNFGMAIFVSRLMIRDLGDEAYGLWALVFSVVEYYGLVDLGIRSAMVKYVAQHTALGEEEQLHKTLNTAFGYFTVVACLLFVFTLVFGPMATRVFVVSPELRETFTYVTILAGCTWSVGLVFVCVNSSLEAVQRFDVTSRIGISVSVLRVAGIVTALQLGYGLMVVVTVAVIVRLLQCGLLYLAFRRQFQTFRWRWMDFDRATFRKLFGFSIHTLPAGFGSVLIEQGPAVAIGHALPAQFVGYFSLPRRLVQAIQDLVFRLGIVTTAKAAELVAHGRRDELVRLGVQSNRYALAIFMPAAIFFGLFAEPIVTLWTTNEFARLSAPLLPVFVVGVLFSDAIQFNSSSILYGLARHQLYSVLRMIEGVALTAAVYYFALRGDLWSAAAVSSALMVVNRGVITPIILCKELQYPLLRYLREIAVMPFVAGGAVAAVMWALREILLPGRTLVELGIAGVLCPLLFAVIAGRLCVLTEHQQDIVNVVRRRLPVLEEPVRYWLGVAALDRQSVR